MHTLSVKNSPQRFQELRLFLRRDVRELGVGFQDLLVYRGHHRSLVHATLSSLPAPSSDLLGSYSAMHWPYFQKLFVKMRGRASAL